MRKTNELFNSEVVYKKNVNALDQVYTSDARILPPGVDMIEGRAAIKSFWQQTLAGMNVKSSKLTTVDAEALGDRVLEIGRADLTSQDGQNVTVKSVVEWKEADGNWKWDVEMWH